MLKIAKKNNNTSINNVITRICNVVFATLPSNLFFPIDSHILDFEIFSENHNFILIKQIIFSYTKIRLHYFNKQFNTKTKRQGNFKDFKRFGAFKGLVEQKTLYSTRSCVNWDLPGTSGPV
jgi:hypothetical protein